MSSNWEKSSRAVDEANLQTFGRDGIITMEVAVTLSGIFSNPHLNAEIGTIDVGMSYPKYELRTTDVENVCLSEGKMITIGGQPFSIVRIEPDGQPDGLTMLILRAENAE